MFALFHFSISAVKVAFNLKIENIERLWLFVVEGPNGATVTIVQQER